MTARRYAAGAMLAIWPALAHAHLITTGLGPVYDGITHFALTPEDLVPVVALALFAGLRGKDHARRVMFALPLAWLVAGTAGASIGGTMPAYLASVPLLALGGLAAADLRVRPAATMTLALLVGAFLGWANGAAMAQTGAGLRGIVGIACAVFVVATLVSACVAAWQCGWMRIAWRVAGSWIAAGGLLLLGWSLR